MTRLGTCVLAFILTIAGASIDANVQSPPSSRTFSTRLSPVPIDLTMMNVVAGTGAVTATLSGRTLTVSGSFKGLKSAATVVRLHRSPNRGIRGPAIGDLVVEPATMGAISGSATLTADQVEDLQKGRLYVQLHSEKAPDGNLWGWLGEGKEKVRSEK